MLKETQGTVKQRRRSPVKAESPGKHTRSSETYKNITEIERILKRGTSKDVLGDFTPSEL